jgi:hypothetical protein
MSREDMVPLSDDEIKLLIEGLGMLRAVRGESEEIDELAIFLCQLVDPNG